MALFLIVDNADTPRAVGVFLNGHHAVNVGKHPGAFGGPHLKEFLHPRQAGGDVGTGNAPGVESPHRELSAGFANALRGNDADGLPDFHQLPGGRQTPVAQLANAAAGLTGQRGTHGNAVDAGISDLFGDFLVNHFVAVNDDFAAAGGGNDVAGDAARDALLQTRCVVHRNFFYKVSIDDCFDGCLCDRFSGCLVFRVNDFVDFVEEARSVGLVGLFDFLIDFRGDYFILTNNDFVGTRVGDLSRGCDVEFLHLLEKVIIADLAREVNCDLFHN